MAEQATCPFCGNSATETNYAEHPFIRVTCRVCGVFDIHSYTLHALEGARNDPASRAQLAKVSAYTRALDIRRQLDGRERVPIPYLIHPQSPQGDRRLGEFTLDEAVELFP